MDAQRCAAQACARAAGLMEMTDDQLVRQLAGLSAGAAVFGGVDDADGFGVRHPSHTPSPCSRARF